MHLGTFELNRIIPRNQKSNKATCMLILHIELKVYSTAYVQACTLMRNCSVAKSFAEDHFLG
jgi:hypothetical protein